MTDHIRPHIGRTHGSKNSAMQDRAIRTREAVIAVAAQQFDIEGYGNATINTILAAGKFARGAVYYHFPSKEAIAQQLIADWNLAIDESTHDASEHAAGGAASDRLTAIFSSLAQEHRFEAIGAVRQYRVGTHRTGRRDAPGQLNRTT